MDELKSGNKKVIKIPMKIENFHTSFTFYYTMDKRKIAKKKQKNREKKNKI